VLWPLTGFSLLEAANASEPSDPCRNSSGSQLLGQFNSCSHVPHASIRLQVAVKVGRIVYPVTPRPYLVVSGAPQTIDMVAVQNTMSQADCSTQVSEPQVPAPSAGYFVRMQDSLGLLLWMTDVESRE